MDVVYQRLVELLDRTDVLVALYDSNDLLVYANAQFRKEFGLELGEQISWAEMMRKGWLRQKGTKSHTGDFETWLRAAKSRRGKLPFKSYETDMKSGRWLWMTETVNEDGWFLTIAPDITQLHSFDEREARLDRDMALRLSNIDELTGIFNRRGIFSALDAALIAPQNKGQPLSICIADLDHFKRINDVHGHAVGDRVIRDFTAVVQNNIRSADYFGRIGGEEFLIVFQNLACEEAKHAVDRIRSAVAIVRISVGINLDYSFSAGISCFSDNQTRQELIDQADAALYRAKANGRGRTEIFAS